jgi:hypothetical protein
MELSWINATLQVAPQSGSNPQPSTLNPKPETRNPKPETRNPKPETRHTKPETRHTKPEPLNPKPETRNPNEQCLYSPNAYRGFAREFLKDVERLDPKTVRP